MSLSNFEKVIEFNRTFGVPVYDELQTDIFDSDAKLVELRVALIREEIGELKEAIDENNMIEIIDALSDILYVAYGMGCSFGINLDKSIDELYKKHYDGLDTKEIMNDEPTNYRKTVEMNRLIGLPYYDDVQFDALTENSLMVKFNYDVIKASFEKLLKFVESKNMDGVTEALSYLICSVYRMGCTLGIDLDKAMGMVHDSNMSKLCNNEAEAQQTVSWYKNEYDEGRLNYDTPSYRVDSSSGKYIVYNSNTGKILKNINYNAVNFSKFK